jgi:hypothetical protein
MLCCLERRMFNHGRIPSRMRSITFHKAPFATVDVSKDLNCGMLRLFLHESVQPFPGRLDVLDRK